MKYSLVGGLRVALLALALFPIACAGVVLSGRSFAPRPPTPIGALSVGAARVDITPPPGYAMGGYSAAGEVARGSWGRLSARAICFRDVAGEPLVLVSTDLWAMPAGLKDRALERLATGEQPLSLAREQVVFAATHTHQSPGNFSSSRFYNNWASHWPGFDQRLFEWLAERLESVVRDACGSSQPGVTLSWGETTVDGVMKNRSLDAFLLNSNARTLLVDSAAPLNQRAVDHRVRHLRIADHSGRPIAIAGFVALHPTALAASTPLYSADLFGIASRRLERETDTIVALFNGAEGDISPLASEARDRADVVALGNKIADAVTRALGSEVPQAGDLRIRHHYRTLKLAGDCAGVALNERCASTRPLMGVGTIGGAEDGRSFLHELGWREGVGGPYRSTQGHKQAPFDPPFFPLSLPFGISLTGLAMPSRHVPREVPLAIHELGDIAFVTLPGEFTYALGAEIESRVKAALGIKHVVLIGLADEYLSYFTTPSEFDAQHYEGSSTLYGTYAGERIVENLAGLAHDDKLRDRDTRYRHKAGPGKDHFGIDALGAAPALAHLDRLTVDSAHQSIAVTSACWDEPQVAFSPGATTTPRVGIQDQVGATVATDDDHDIVVTMSHSHANQVRWCATWLAPPVIAGKYFAHVVAADGSVKRCRLHAGTEAQFAHLETGCD